MFILILVNVILGAEFSCKTSSQTKCDLQEQCAWTSAGCVVKLQTCTVQSQDECLNSVDCSWDTCLHQCRPFDLVDHECSQKDNFCRIKIDGKLMSKEMCTITNGCAWDMCYSSCNQNFLIPSKCKESSSQDVCKKFDVGSCFAEEGCGWDKCSKDCKKEGEIVEECVTRLGLMPGMSPMMPGMTPRMTPGMPGRMTPGMPRMTPGRMTPGRMTPRYVAPGMPGYASAGRMPMLKFDPSTGRQYKPYHRRPLLLDRSSWMWMLALPFMCMIVFCLGYNFPKGWCDSTEHTGPGGDVLLEGEEVMGSHHGRSASNFHSGAHISIMQPNSDYTTSTIHTMSSKPASQIRVPTYAPEIKGRNTY